MNSGGQFCYIIHSELHHKVSFAGCFSILPATELVPGDIVEVAGKFSHSAQKNYSPWRNYNANLEEIHFNFYGGIVGCKIPADMRMIEMLSNQLRVDQAILTGIFFFFHTKYHVCSHKSQGIEFFRYIQFWKRVTFVPNALWQIKKCTQGHFFLLLIILLKFYPWVTIRFGNVNQLLFWVTIRCGNVSLLWTSGCVCCC